MKDLISQYTKALKSRFSQVLLVGMLMLFAVPAALAQGDPEPVTLDFDLTPFFDALNTYLPIFIGLFAIVGGIAGAIALARFVINAVVNAFRGGSI